jgi:hypothetical protein
MSNEQQFCNECRGDGTDGRPYQIECVAKHPGPFRNEDGFYEKTDTGIKQLATPTVAGNYVSLCADCDREMWNADKRCRLCTDCQLDPAIKAAFDATFGTEPNEKHLSAAMTKLADAAMSPPPGCAILTGAECVAISLHLRQINRKSRSVQDYRDVLQDIATGAAIMMQSVNPPAVRRYAAEVERVAKSNLTALKEAQPRQKPARKLPHAYTPGKGGDCEVCGDMTSPLHSQVKTGAPPSQDRFENDDGRDPHSDLPVEST